MEQRIQQDRVPSEVLTVLGTEMPTVKFSWGAKGFVRSPDQNRPDRASKPYPPGPPVSIPGRLGSRKVGRVFSQEDACLKTLGSQNCTERIVENSVDLTPLLVQLCRFLHPGRPAGFLIARNKGGPASWQTVSH